MESIELAGANAFWSGRACLVTGSTGFVGSHLSETLAGLGAKVVGVGLPVSQAQQGCADVHGRLESPTDICDWRALRDLCEEFKVEVVFHLAAVSTLDEVMMDPFDAIRVNTLGTAAVLEAVRAIGSVRSIVVASSDKVYGHQDVLPSTELASLTGNHIYDSSKIAAEAIANAFSSSFGLPIAITRCSNIYGPGDHNVSRLIPQSILRAISGRPARMFAGREDSSREFLYVSDAIKGYLSIAQLMTTRSDSPDRRAIVYNLGGGPDNVRTVSQVIASIQEMLDVETCSPDVSQRTWEASLEIDHQRLDSSKIKDEVNWEPTVQFDEGLRRTIDWYLKCSPSTIATFGDLTISEQQSGV